MTQVGGCLCGGLRYSFQGEPKTTATCHCTDCRKSGGATYSTNLMVPEEQFEVKQGKPKTYECKADSGKPVVSYFCDNCGTTIFRKAELFEGINIVKAGTLDNTNSALPNKPQEEFFTINRIPWQGHTGENQHERMT